MSRAIISCPKLALRVAVGESRQAPRHQRFWVASAHLNSVIAAMELRALEIEVGYCNPVAPISRVKETPLHALLRMSGRRSEFTRACREMTHRHQQWVEEHPENTYATMAEPGDLVIVLPVIAGKGAKYDSRLKEGMDVREFMQNNPLTVIVAGDERPEVFDLEFTEVSVDALPEGLSLLEQRFELGKALGLEQWALELDAHRRRMASV